jgi:hypothetical protein
MTDPMRVFGSALLFVVPTPLTRPWRSKVFNLGSAHNFTRKTSQYDNVVGKKMFPPDSSLCNSQFSMY